MKYSIFRIPKATAKDIEKLYKDNDISKEIFASGETDERKTHLHIISIPIITPTKQRQKEGGDG